MAVWSCTQGSHATQTSGSSPLHPHAQVWAHPDDLATIIQGIRSQEQLGGPRLVSIAVQGWWGKLRWLGCKVLSALG